eukprot:c42238_g1_i1 orf=268-612(+)
MLTRSGTSGRLKKSGPLEQLHPLAFDLGEDLNSNEKPWKLQEVMARAGEEADQHYLEVTLDVHDDSIMLRNVLPTSDDLKTDLLSDEANKKNSLLNLIHNASNSSGRLGHFSRE